MGTPNKFESLATTQQFWNASPCGGHSDLEARRQHRYRMEPWLPAILEEIGKTNTDIVEIGCGQGTDALYICGHMPPGGSYLGIDYSNESIARAEAALEEHEDSLSVTPDFKTGNVEELAIGDAAADCVYSFGVLHHTANEQKGIEEIYRILRPGGRAYIFLYNMTSPKLVIAKSVRGVQRVLDFIFQSKNALYRLILGHHAESVLGTMLLECTGVPYLKCYTKNAVRHLFSDFEICSLRPIGYNLPWLKPQGSGRSPVGVFWMIEVTKPN